MIIRHLLLVGVSGYFNSGVKELREEFETGAALRDSIFGKAIELSENRASHVANIHSDNAYGYIQNLRKKYGLANPELIQVMGQVHPSLLRSVAWEMKDEFKFAMMARLQEINFELGSISDRLGLDHQSIESEKIAIREGINNLSERGNVTAEAIRAFRDRLDKFSERAETIARKAKTLRHHQMMLRDLKERIADWNRPMIP